MFARAVTAPLARATGRRFISVGEKVPVASATSGMYAVVVRTLARPGSVGLARAAHDAVSPALIGRIPK